MQDVFQCALSLGRKEEGRQGGNGRRGTNKNKVKAKTKEKALITGYGAQHTPDCKHHTHTPSPHNTCGTDQQTSTHHTP
jgi:hypothetical protein